ncbi:hypothetical protein [Prevotella histicola]|uniref:hypothetical protein n=1 Tax=Prevotella histicola TaxID=470565 RepID=UPI0028E73533|nr:hypothetical protein [Prevotella histicola]
MQTDDFVLTGYGSPSELQVAAPNLETKRAGIHRTQQKTREKETVRSGHFKKCHSSLGYFLHAALRYR